MYNDIERNISEKSRFEITKNNLEFFGDLMPRDSVLVINFEDYKDRAKYSIDYICSGLKEALDFPNIQEINIKKSSVILFDNEGEKGLFLANKVLKKQSRIGLPGFIPDNSRSYYGVIWGKGNEPTIYYSFGSDFFPRESHPMSERDINAIHSLCYVLSDFSLNLTTDPMTKKKSYRLLGIKERNKDCDYYHTL